MRRGFKILRIAALSGAAVSAFFMVEGVLIGVALAGFFNDLLGGLAAFLIAERSAGAVLLCVAAFALIEALGATFRKVRR